MNHKAQTLVYSCADVCRAQLQRMCGAPGPLAGDLDRDLDMLRRDVKQEDLLAAKQNT